MAARKRAENVLTAIINRILTECVDSDETNTETLAAYMVKAVVLDPTSGFAPEKLLTNQEIEALIKTCVKRLLDKESVSLDTMKMQMYFELNHLDREEFLQEHYRVMHSRMEAIMTEALEVHGSSDTEKEDVYRRILSTVLLRSALGSPTNLDVLRETAAALQSIFPQEEVKNYMQAPIGKRRTQLQEMSELVTGIRLFNKECCKGGAGIDDLPYLLTNGIPKAMGTLHKEMERAKEHAALYTSLFLKISAYDNSPNALSSANVAAETAAKMGITPFSLKAAVVNARQYEAFLGTLEHDLITMSKSVEQHCQQFAQLAKELRQVVSNREAIPSTEVFPGFLKLSELWRSLQDEMVYLSVLTTILNKINDCFVGRRLKWSVEKLSSLISDSEIVHDDQMKPNGPVALEDRGRFMWMFPEGTSEKLKPDLEGFCVWNLIKHQGLLVRADNSIGWLKMPKDGRTFAFNSLEAVRDFVLTADSFLEKLPSVVRQLPEIIQFLNLGYLFTDASSMDSKIHSKLAQKPYSRVDAQMQTELHPIESYFEKQYDWNEWELRKKALKLANLRKKATHSVQTMLSNWRRDNATQVYLPKDSSTSTKENAYTQVPKPSVFYHGLRGCGGIDQAIGAEQATLGHTSWCTTYRPTNATTVDLTIPVEQQLLTNMKEGVINWL